MATINCSLCLDECCDGEWVHPTLILFEEEMASSNISHWMKLCRGCIEAAVSWHQDHHPLAQPLLPPFQPPQPIIQAVLPVPPPPDPGPPPPFGPGELIDEHNIFF